MSLLRSAPMLFIAVLLASGILSSHYVDIPVIILFLLIILSVVSVLLIDRPSISLIFLAVSVFLLGAVLISSSERYVRKDDISFHADGSIVNIVGVVDSYLDRRENKAFIYVKPETIEKDSEVHRVSGRLRAIIYGEVERVSYGDRVSLTGRLVLPRGRTNPGGFDYRGWLLARGVRSLLYVKEINDVESGLGNPFIALSYWLRDRALTAIDGFAGGISGSLLKGMLVGERRGVPENIQEDFRKAGVIHIIAISGQNLTLVGFATYLLLSVFGLSKKINAIVVIPVIVLYSIMTGMDPPVVRALIMGLLVLFAVILELRVSLLNIIGASMTIFLLLNPLMLFDVGFQLSFAATLGIAVLYTPITRLMGFIPHFIREILSATISAQVGVMPLLAYHFYSISVVSFIANLIIVPLSSIVMVVGFIALILYVPFNFVGASLGEVSALLSTVIIKISALFSHLGWATLNVARPDIELVVFIYTAIGLIILTIRQAFRRGALLALGGVVALYGIGMTVKQPEPDFRLTFLSVGDGRAIVAEIGDKCYLFDCGSKVGEKVASGSVESYLALRGIDRIDGVIVSHPHSDHINGLSEVLNRFDVVTIYDISYPYPSKAYIEMLVSLKGDTVYRRVMGYFTLKLDDKTFLSFYSPKYLPPVVGAGCYPDGEKMNSCGIVNVLTVGGLRIYLPSDNECVFDILRGRYQIIEFPHHGSKNKNIWRFIDESKPRVILLSSGRMFRDRYYDIEREMEPYGIEVISTDNCGAITIEVRGERCVITTEY